MTKSSGTDKVSLDGFRDSEPFPESERLKRVRQYLFELSRLRAEQLSVQVVIWELMHIVDGLEMPARGGYVTEEKLVS